MEGDQLVQSHSHAQQPLKPCVQEHCPGETGLPSPIVLAVLKCISRATFQSPDLLIQCGFNWK